MGKRPIDMEMDALPLNPRNLVQIVPTVCGETSTSEVIPTAGPGSHHSVDVDPEEVMMAPGHGVLLPFDVDNEDYGSFINKLRTELANHRDHESNVLKYGDWLRKHPLLPKQEPFGPARWIYIKLSALDDKNKIHTTTLAVRGDNLYLIGFKNNGKNKDEKWFEFGKNDPEQQQKDHLPQVKRNNNQKKQKDHLSEVKQKQKQKKQKDSKKNIPTDEHLIEGSAWLGFESVYGALVGTPVWQKLDNLGKSSIRPAVFLLSAYGTTEQKKDQCIQKCLGKLIAILCEPARMFPHKETVETGWGAGFGITLTEQLEKYMHSWEKMSRAMMDSDEYPFSLVNIGMKNQADALKVVHLILYSEKFKKAGDNGPAKNKSARPDHDKTRKDDPPPKEDGNDNDNSFQPENGNDKKNGENHQGKNHNGEGQQQRKQHSLCLVEVFALRHTDTAGSPFVGRIAIFDGRRGQIIYSNEQNEDAPPEDKEPNLVLTGPYRVVSAGGMVALKITRTAAKVHRVTIWDPYSEASEHRYDMPLRKNIPGGLELTYAALSSAVGVTVQVDIFLFGDTSVTAAVHGEITAKSRIGSVVLFSRESNDKEELIPSYTGSTIEFTRSVVAWSVGQPLVINVGKLHVTVDDTTTTPFKEPEFTFEDHTHRVCFTILEGIGYARVSVDDTGEYRDETNNWLPRSLRFKTESGRSIDTEDLIFTFEPNNVLPCLLHLTNKSGDRRVAFRCCPGQEESAAYFNDFSEISVILPPDSTSTYLVKLEGQQPPDRDELSLFLESCVALEDHEDVEEEEEDEDDVDEIFSKQTRAGIKKVTLQTTAAADKKTMTCEIIPHNVNQEEAFAGVRIDLFLFGDTPGKTNIYGEITAHTQHASGKKEKVVLFSCGIEKNMEFIHSSAGSTIPLTQSDVSWPVGSSLLINVHLHARNRFTFMPQGTATPSKCLEFSFPDHTEKVRFATLKGIGYIRVSVDDTGGNRKELGNSLPRSLMNQMNPDMSIQNELLLVNPRQLSFTYDRNQLSFDYKLRLRARLRNQLMTCLLHLTNKSYDQRIAFRHSPSYDQRIAFPRSPYQGYFHRISELSGILPPDSTSTYLIRLKIEKRLPSNMDERYLILETLVTLVEGEEDVDKIFRMRTNHRIVEVPLMATVYETAASEEDKDEVEISDLKEDEEKEDETFDSEEDEDRMFDVHTRSGIDKETLEATVSRPADMARTCEPIEPEIIKTIPHARGDSTHSKDVQPNKPMMAGDLTYAVMRRATVQVHLFLFRETDLHGKISAHSQLASGEEVSVVLFSSEFENRLELKPSSNGWNVPLAQSVVAWPLGAPLLIKVCCFHSVSLWHEGSHYRTKFDFSYSTRNTTTIHECNSASTSSTSIFDGVEFSFDDHTDKVRFATLEGFGYIRVSVDDTGEDREKPNNSLPRSLMNQMSPDMWTENKLLVIRPSQLMPGILHLTNKSDDQHVAFRCGNRPRYGDSTEWVLYGILPPDSTSTYSTVGLRFANKYGTLILQSCAASQDEKDVDTVFLNPGKSEIEEITFMCRTSTDVWMQPAEDLNTIFSKPSTGIKEVTLKPTVSHPTDVTMTSETQIKAPITESSIDQSDLLDVYPLPLRFTFNLDKVICCPLRLTNRTDDHVIWKCLPYTGESKLDGLYLIKGILAPRSSLTYILATKKENHLPENIDALSVVLKSCAAEKIPKAICCKEPILIPQKIEITTMIGYASPIVSMDVHPTESWILASHTNRTVSIWNYDTQAEPAVIELTDVRSRWIPSAKFIAREKWFVAGDGDGSIHVFTYTTLTVVKKFKAHERWVDSLAVHPNQPFVLSASFDTLIKLWKWDVDGNADWECLQTYGGHSLSVRYVMFNPYDNGNTFASASTDSEVKIWSTNDRNNSASPIATLDCDGDQQGRLAYFSLGGRQYIITGSLEGAARVWDLHTNTCIKELDGRYAFRYGCSIGGVDCVPENINPVLISVSKDHTISFLDAGTIKTVSEDRTIFFRDAHTYESRFNHADNYTARLVIVVWQIDDVRIGVPMFRYEKVNFGKLEIKGFAYVEIEGKRRLMIALREGIAIMEIKEDSVNEPATVDQAQGVYST